jgi:hypothetical protein
MMEGIEKALKPKSHKIIWFYEKNTAIILPKGTIPSSDLP